MNKVDRSAQLLSSTSMALNNGGREPPLISALVNPTPDQTNVKKTYKKRRGRRYRRARSAPHVVNIGPPQEGNRGSLPPFKSIFQKLRPSFRQVVVLLAVYLGVGAVCFSLVRKQLKGTKTVGILDAVYFCIVTMTTVGYGDLVPNSVATKLLACAFVISGMALVGLVLSKAADYLVEKQEILLVKALHINQKPGPSDILKEVEANGVRYKCAILLILLLLLMFAGTIFLHLVEEMNFVDAFYCVCSTMTTLGYGDKSFSTQAGRIFAVFWILISTLCLAQFFLSIAELKTESRQRSLVKWVLTRRLTNLDLEAADLDDDGVVDLAEFIVFKFKEMGKISQKDISLVMEAFEDLDVDESGTLTAMDIVLAQSPDARR